MSNTMTSPSVRIQNGSLYLDAQVFNTFFPGLHSVGVMRQGEALMIMALLPGGSGGSLAKVRNARGDRVIHARELMADLELDESRPVELVARWDSELAALTMTCSGRRE